MPKRSFQEIVEILLSLNVNFQVETEYRGEPPERKLHKLELFCTLQLPFTPEEWCSTCMQEGDAYIGGCCGSASDMQSLMNSIFREGGWASIVDLCSLAESLKEHDASPAQQAMLTVANWKTLSPWDKVEVLWDLVQDY